MIKFFRHIRKSLLNEGKTSKYLKYAIGEIALVMIGILLALQVNNWNNNRIAKQVELNQIKQLLEDAKSDLVFFESRAKFLNSINSLQSLVLGMYNNEIQDSISKLKKIDYPLFGVRLAHQSSVVFNNKDAIDIIKNENGDLSVIEVNSGVMLVNLALKSEEGYKVAKDIYKRGIILMMS